MFLHHIIDEKREFEREEFVSQGFKGLDFCTVERDHCQEALYKNHFLGVKTA